MATRSKILRIQITATDPETLGALLSEYRLHLFGGGPKRDEGGTVSVHALVPEDQVKGLKKYAVKIDILDADAGATARARQKEVGKGDPFVGKNRVPRGLGRKLKEGGRGVS
jgi:hypothetical protein